MRLVQSDCVWIDAATAGPLPAIAISLAEEPDARDATSRRQDICEEHYRATRPFSLQGRTSMSTAWNLSVRTAAQQFTPQLSHSGNSFEFATLFGEWPSRQRVSRRSNHVTSCV
jgi:hypothetical protein